MIFWAAVIGLWHVDMFPRIFGEDAKKDFKSGANALSGATEVGSTTVMPTMENTGVIGLLNRGKYTRKSFVIADFSPIDANYGVNRLYTVALFSLGVMSFIIVGYGLHSGFSLPA